MHKKPETISQRGGDTTEGRETNRGPEGYSESEKNTLKAHV